MKIFWITSFELHYSWMSIKGDKTYVYKAPSFWHICSFEKILLMSHCISWHNYKNTVKIYFHLYLKIIDLPLFLFFDEVFNGSTTSFIAKWWIDAITATLRKLFLMFSAKGRNSGSNSISQFWLLTEKIDHFKMEWKHVH